MPGLKIIKASAENDNIRRLSLVLKVFEHVKSVKNSAVDRISSEVSSVSILVGKSLDL